MGFRRKLWLGNGEVFVWAHRGFAVAPATAGSDTAAAENSLRAFSAPENTLRAFSNAVALGADGLETDLALTKDGQIVLSHDRTVDRVFDASGPVSAFTLADLRKMAARTGDGSDRMTTLNEAFEEFPGIPFTLDPKGMETVEPLVKVLEASGRVSDVVTAFSDSVIDRFRRLRPENLTGAATGEGYRFFRAFLATKYRRRTSPPQPEFDLMQIPYRVRGIPALRRSFIDFSHEYGVPVQPWTITNRRDLVRLVDSGVDAVFTNDPVSEFLKSISRTWDRERTKVITGD